MRLKWPDLLIEDIISEDFEWWMEEWTGFIDGPIAPAFMSKFGAWFFRRPAGQVEMLDVFTGAVERLADSYEAFVADVNQQWWQEVYLLSELVFKLHEVGKVPGPGECYALAPHPALGGPNPMLDQSVDSQFVMVMDIGVWQSLCARTVRGGV